jgi:Tfp pilus assembly protein PilO
MKPAAEQTRNAESWKVDAGGIGALAALTALAYFLGAAPLLSRHEAVRQQQAELAAAGESRHDATLTLDTVQRELAQVEQQLAGSPLHLESPQALNQRLALLTELATESGARLDDVQPSRASDGLYYGSLPIHVSGSGAYPTFAALLRRVRERCPDMGISTFDVFGTAQDAEGRSKFNFELVWYVAPAKAEAGKGAAANGAGEPRK